MDRQAVEASKQRQAVRLARRRAEVRTMVSVNSTFVDGDLHAAKRLLANGGDYSALVAAIRAATHLADMARMASDDDPGSEIKGQIAWSAEHLANVLDDIAQARFEAAGGWDGVDDDDD